MERINVALFVSELSDPFAHNLCAGAVRASSEQDYNLFIFPGKYIDGRQSFVYEDPFLYQSNCLYQFVDANRIDVVIANMGNIASRWDEERKREFLSKIPVPVILVADAVEGYPSVMYDNQVGTDLAIEHLIEAHGKRHFGYVSGPKSNVDAMERLVEFEKIMEKHGIDKSCYRIVEGDFSGESDAVIGGLIDTYPEMDALVCANDLMAYGAYRAAKQRGLKVGEDIAVIGFDDSPYSAHIKPSLTTVKADPTTLGYRAVSLCEKVLAGETPNDLIPTTFVARTSCGCKKRRSAHFNLEYGNRSSVESLVNTLVGVSRNILDYEEANRRIYSMIVSDICQLDVQSVFLYTFPEDIVHKKDEPWQKPDRVQLQAYYMQECPRHASVAYQPLPVYYYEIDPKDVRDVSEEDRMMPFDRIFLDPALERDEPIVRVITMLYAGDTQYGFMVWGVDDKYFSYLDQLSYQISSALKTNKLLQKKNDMANALSDSLLQVREKNLILEEISKIDELTQIYNRRGFLDAMKRRVIDKKNRGKRGVAIYADMNDLKLVNDQFGHEEGDFALRMIAQILSESVNSFGPIGEVGRIGGDEFCAYVLTEDPNPEALIRERIEELTKRMNHENDKPYYVSLSAGMREFVCSDEIEISALLEEADAQLYEKKKDKRVGILK